MRPDQVDLELLEVIGGNDFVSEVAEASVDSVDYSALLAHEVFDDLAALLYFEPDCFSEFDFESAVDDEAEVAGRERFSIKVVCLIL